MNTLKNIGKGFAMVGCFLLAGFVFIGHFVMDIIGLIIGAISKG